MIDVYMDRLEHPYLFSLLPITLLLFALGFVTEAVGFPRVAGFMGLYAMVAIILFAIGYFGFYSLRFGGEALRWWRVRKGAGY